MKAHEVLAIIVVNNCAAVILLTIIIVHKANGLEDNKR